MAITGKRYKKEVYKVALPSGRVAGEILRRRPHEITVKRDCSTGRFAPAKVRALGCAILDRPREEWTKPRKGDRSDRVCYRTRGEALRAFIHWNRKIVEIWGLDAPATGGEFDSLNERLRGKRRVTTLSQAIDRAMPKGRPFCLDRIDLDVLNETTPGRMDGPFVLPDAVAEAELYTQYQAGLEAYHRPAAPEEVPF